MSRKLVSGLMRDVARPPEGKNWCWLTADLLASPAWRAQSIHCRRLLDFLMLEHLNHGGRENGFLRAPFAQLEQWGIGRRYIAPAIREAEALGLIKVNHGARKAYSQSAMSVFRLTPYQTRERPEEGPEFWAAPTDEWKRVTTEQAKKVINARPRAPRQKKFPGAPPVTETGSPLSPVRFPPVTSHAQNSATAFGSPLSTPFYISGGGGQIAFSLWLHILSTSPIACALIIVVSLPADDLHSFTP